MPILQQSENIIQINCKSVNKVNKCHFDDFLSQSAFVSGLDSALLSSILGKKRFFDNNSNSVAFSVYIPSELDRNMRFPQILIPKFYSSKCSYGDFFDFFGGHARTPKASIEGCSFKTLKKIKNILQEWFLSNSTQKSPRHLKNQKVAQKCNTLHCISTWN